MSAYWPAAMRLFNNHQGIGSYRCPLVGSQPFLVFKMRQCLSLCDLFGDVAQANPQA